MEIYAAPIEAPGIVFTEGRYDHAASEAAETEYMDKLAEYGKSTGHPLGGEFISKPYADGRAVYMVAKVSNKTALIHVEAGDAWRDPQFERLVTVAEVKRLLDSQKKMAALFGSVSA